MLLFFTFPVFWILLSMAVMGAAISQLEGQYGSYPTTPGIEVFSAVMALMLIAVAVISLILPISLFFERNWLAWLIKWLSPDGRILKLTEIVIRIDPPAPPAARVPVIPTPEPVKPKPTEPEPHPDEKYMPPQFRSKK